MYKIECLVPVSHVEIVKEALFDAGAGRVGNYDRCCFCVQGVGQFRAKENANPTIGSIGADEFVDEVLIHIACPSEYIECAIDAIRKSHPYETPAFAYWKISYK